MDLSKRFYVALTACSSGAMGSLLMWALFPQKGFYCACGVFASVMGMGLFIERTSPFDKLFENLDLKKGNDYPTFREKEKKDGYTLYKFKQPPGLTIEEIIEKQGAIEQYLGKPVEIEYTYKEFVVKVYDKGLPTRWDYEYMPPKGAVAFPVGVNLRGEVVWCTLTKGSPHLIIAGETGGGKSTALRAIITSLILSDRIKLHLIDLKNGTEFKIFEQSKKVVSFAKSEEDAVTLLDNLENEVNKRYDLFYENDVKDIVDYNFKGGKMGYEVLVVDEFADLADNAHAIKTMEKLSAKARACGIHLIISTQRPDAKVINGRIKDNFGAVLGLKTSTEINSRIILDKGGLEKLKGNGHAIFKKDGEDNIIQCPFLDTDPAVNLIKHTYIKKDMKQSIINGMINDFKFLNNLIEGL
jgi:S-DNA-T family DNA segregation ATPase FtsK/SpoIIIE